MVMVEAAFLIGLVGLMVYGAVWLLMRPGSRRHPSSLPGTWRVAHYDVKGETHIVLQRIPEGGVSVLDEHVVASVRADDPDYDREFLAAMDTARQRRALFEAEESP